METFMAKPWVQLPLIKLQQLLQYPQLQRRVNNHEIQILGTRNLIMKLKKQKMGQLRQQFMLANNKVNLNQFMWLILHSISIQKQRDISFQDQCQKYQHEYQLVKIFQDIDINCSNFITWSQFIQYITSSTITRTQKMQQTQFFISTSKKQSTNQLIFSHQQKPQFRKNFIKTITQIGRLGILAIVQSNSDTLTFLTNDGNFLPKPYQLLGVDPKKVMSFDYSPQQKVFGVLLNTNHIVFIVDGERQRVYDSKITRNQLQIIYFPKNRLWILTFADNSIQLFKLSYSNQKYFQNRQILYRYKPHNSNIIAIRQIQNPLSIITASPNNQLKIWDVQTNQLIVQLNPCKQYDLIHSKSIKGFQVANMKEDSYVICWTFSNQIYVWLPSYSLSKPYVGKLQGHPNIIETAQFFSNFPMVVSIDCKKTVKVWDLLKLQCIQSLKLQRSCVSKIKVLKSVPYILFYQKTIQFYLSTQQKNLKLFNQQIRLINYQKSQKLYKNQGKVKEVQKQLKQQNKPLLVEDINEQAEKANEKQPSKKQPSAKKEPIINKKNKKQYPIQTVIQIGYDTYLNFLIILMKNKLLTIGINTGTIINTAYPESKQQVFVTMCLKQSQRLFIANSFGEIIYIKTEDCSKIYKLYLYNSSINPHLLSMSLLSFKNSLSKIFKIDYNIYNDILLVVIQLQKSSLIITYDNILQDDATKQKQIIVNQQNLCGFCSSIKYNLFYLASNCPEIVSIWDYHNFVKLKSIGISSPIQQLRCQSDKYNILIIRQAIGIRILQMIPNNAKNNTQQIDKNIINYQLLIKCSTPINTLEILAIKKKKPTSQQPKNKQPTHDNASNIQKQGRIKKLSGKKKIHYQWKLYIQHGSTIEERDISKVMDKLIVYAEPIHCSKANITRQFKKLKIKPSEYYAPQQTIKLQDFQKQVIINQNGINLVGKVNDLVYFNMNNGILNFYKCQEKRVMGKLFMPNCQIIQWQIFENLLTKTLTRLKKAQKLSKQISTSSNNQPLNEKHLQQLRLYFLLNKYFTNDDLQNIIKFIQHKNNNGQVNQKESHQQSKLNHMKSSSDFRNQYKKNEYLQQQNQQKLSKKLKIKSASVYKAKKIQKNFVFSIKQLPYKTSLKRKSEEQQQQQKPQKRSKVRSISDYKLKKIQKKFLQTQTLLQSLHHHGKFSQKCSPQHLKNDAIPSFQSTIIQSASPKKQLKSSHEKNRIPNNFKIHNSVWEVNKMHYQNLKQIKNCLRKVGILNSDTLKL